MKMNPSQRLRHRLNQQQSQLTQARSLDQVAAALKAALGRVARVMIQPDTEVVIVHGEFDPETNRVCIILQGPAEFDAALNARQLIWQVWQAVQHEQQHQVQYMQRPDAHRPRQLSWSTDHIEGAAQRQQRSYLSDLDEVDAFGQDIALEVTEFLQGDVRRFSETDTWIRYAHAFAGTQWTRIRQRLLRRAWHHFQQQ